MNSNIGIGRQTGVALILSLLILLVLTVIGVAAMNSTIMQERMAGNARTQAEVFEKSSEGVGRALELYYDEDQNLLDNIGVLAADENSYDLVCGQVFSPIYNAGYGTDPRTAEAWAYPTDGSWIQTDTGNPKLEQKMYCCRNWVFDDDTSSWLENPSKLFVLNRGTFMGGDDPDALDESLALREIEVRLSEAEPDEPTCAICVPGDIGTVDGGNSNALRVDGACGAAVVADTNEAATTFLDGVPQNRRGNFDGGIVGGNMTPPWDSPASLAEFVFWVKLGLTRGSTHADAGVGDSNVSGLYIDDPADLPYTDGGNNEYGTAANPQITYINGDAEFGGNITGAGIMIVRGSLSWSGTPAFEGLLISLDGGLIVDGGGGGGNPAGSMVITTLEPTASNDHFGNDPPTDLYGSEVLRYQVARDDSAQKVVMFDESGYNSSSDVRKASGTGFSGVGADEVPSRPYLLGDDAIGLGSMPRLIHYDANDADPTNNRFFLGSASYGTHSKGDELAATPVYDADGNIINFDIEVEYVEAGVTVTGDIRIATQPDSDGDGIPDPTRDAFGRLLPEFVLTDNYPDDYGYNPNAWDWDPTVVGDQFQWGTTNFEWSGGGGESFSYDCRELQKVKHELLCQQQEETNLPTDPQDEFYEDPASHLGDYCWHANAGVDGGTGGGTDGKYGYETPPNSPDPRDYPENQRAWHMWNPTCDCLGVSVDSDMMVSGWRENLGWRDDDNFQGCASLPNPTDGT